MGHTLVLVRVASNTDESHADDDCRNKSSYSLFEESSRANSAECSVAQCLLSTLSRCHTMNQWEFGVLGILHRVRAFQAASTNNSSSDDLNGARASAVSTSHLIIQLADSTRQGNITEFTVHVVSARVGGITQPDGIIIDDA